MHPICSPDDEPARCVSDVLNGLYVRPARVSPLPNPAAQWWHAVQYGGRLFSQQDRGGDRRVLVGLHYWQDADSGLLFLVPKLSRTIKDVSEEQQVAFQQRKEQPAGVQVGEAVAKPQGMQTHCVLSVRW